MASPLQWCLGHHVFLFVPGKKRLVQQRPLTGQETAASQGMTLCGISFSLLFFARYFATDQGIVSSWWLVASYFFQSVGELLVSALGVAMVAELVPQAIVGFIM